MATIANPFQSRQITCPVCDSIADVPVLISEVFGKYFAVKQEKDQYVSEWKWTDEQWQHINPYLYAIILCPHCYYANFIDIFISKMKSSVKRQMRYLKEQIANISGFEKNLIDKIGALFLKDNTNRTHEIAILGMILTLFYQNILHEHKEFEISYGIMARLLLRLSWLYREKSELSGGDSSEQNNGVAPIVANMLDSLRNFHYLNKQVEAQLDTMDEEKSDEVHTIVLFLEEATRRISEKTEEILIHLESTKNQVDKEYNALLNKAVSLWSWIPRNEKQAVERAAEFFIKSATDDYNLSEKGTHQTLELASYLYLKIGDKDKSDHCLKQIINLCHKQRMHLMKKLQTKLSLAQKSEIELEVKRLNTYIEDLTFQFKHENELEPEESTSSE